MLSTLVHEFRQALRALFARIWFSALVASVLASGLACVIFMLAMINGFVLRPLPFAQPEQLLHLGLSDGNNNGRLDNVAGRDLVQLRRQLAGSGEVAGFESATVNLSDLDRPERFDGAMISANLWHVLGVAPLLGRDFNAADERSGAPAVVLLSYELWHSRYGGDPNIVGREVRVNARVGTVVGVMPQNLSYPFREVVWIPAPLSEDANPATDEAYAAVVRRHDGVSIAMVLAAAERWYADAARADPDRLRGQRVGVEPLAHLSVNQVTRAVLGIMLAAVFIVLLVACANAANLLLLRTLSRRQELAVRVALGASRARIALHLLVQSLLLSVIATAIALPLARAGVLWQADAMRQSSNGPPHWLRFEVDWNVVLLAIAAALLTALVTGLLPALRAGRDAVAGTLRDGARGSAGGSFARLSRLLMIGEVALSCALLIVVGTMIRGIVALDHVDLGFDSSHLLTARVGLFTSAYPTGADQTRLFEKLTARLRSDAEVIDASAATVLPLRFKDSRGVLPAGGTPDGDTVPRASYGAVDDHFLSTYGVRLLRGRFFDERDTAGGERVAVVDDIFEQRLGGGGDVIGRRFRLDPRSTDGPTLTIVGVIAPLTLDAPGDLRRPLLLAPLRQDPARFVSLAVHVRGDPAAFAPRLNAIMREVDADTPLYWVRDFGAVIREATFGERIVAQLFGLFGLVALVLAAAGLYGVTAFSVGQRTREIGVRRALGAPARQLLRNLFARIGWQLALGLTIGVVLGVPLARALTSTLHSIESGDPLVATISMAVLVVAAAIAVIIPARRALRVHPTEALRYE